MARETKWLKVAEKEFSKLFPKVRERIRDDIDALEKDPTPQDAIQIKNVAKKLFRLHAGPKNDYVVVYIIHPKANEIISVQHRSKIYRTLSRRKF